MSELTVTNQQILASMQGYAERVKALLPDIYGRRPLACINTYGCQQNFSDGEKLEGLLEEMGYEKKE